MICGLATAAYAQLTGATVNVSAYYPDSMSVYHDPGNVVVSAAVEYPSGSYPSYNPSWEVDVSADQLMIKDATSTGFPFQPADFNGFILEVLSGPTILSAAADPSSGFFPVSLSVVGGTKILANFQGVTGGPGALSSIVNITFVPEPQALTMLVTISLLLVHRRRKTP
jgi:hypothetical protein